MVHQVGTIIKVVSEIAAIKLEWAYTRELFSIILIPTVRKHVNDALAFGIVALVVWVDAPNPVVKEMIEEAFASFEKHVLEIIVTYVAKTPQVVKEEFSIHILTGTGSVKQVVSEREIYTSDLPYLVREEMITRFDQPIQVDVKAYFEEKIRGNLK